MDNPSLPKSLRGYHPRVQQHVLGACARGSARDAFFLLRDACNYQPQAFQMQRVFTSGDINQPPQKFLFDQPVPDTIFIDDVIYSVDPGPDFFAGSVFAPQARRQNEFNPGVSVRMSVEGGGFGDQFTVNAHAGPIQNLIKLANSGEPRDAFPTSWCLTYQSELVVEGFLTRVVPAEWLPYSVAITVKGLRVGCRGKGEYARTSEQAAREAIARAFPDLQDFIVPSPARQLELG